MTRQSIAVGAAALIAFGAGPAFAQDFLRADTVGGSGGSPFEILCPAETVMTGLAIRAGDRVDAAAPICAMALNAQQLDPQTVSVTESWTGGPGGTERNLDCPPGFPGVSSLGVQLFRDGRFVDGLTLRCRHISHDPKSQGGDTFDGVSTEERDRIEGPIGQYSYPAVTACPPRYVAVGIYGRSGRWLDQLGLVCATPVVHNPSVSETVAEGWGERAAETPAKPADLAKPRDAAPSFPPASQIGKKRNGAPQ